MKTAISIPDDIYEQAEQRAAALGISRDELYTTALTNLLSEQSNERITERLNEVYSQHPSELDPVTVRMQAHSLGKEEW